MGAQSPNVNLDEYVEEVTFESPLEQYPELRTDLKCPKCGADMVLRLGRNGPFYGCTKFGVTRCRGSYSADDKGTAIGAPPPKPKTLWQRLLLDS